MGRLLIHIYYLLLFFPAFSLTQALIGVNIQNRILWLPFGVFLLFLQKNRYVCKFNIPIFLLSLFFLYYFIYAHSNEWNVIIYFGYFVTFLLIFVSNTAVYTNKYLFIKFYKSFFVCNSVYVLIQILLLNLNYDNIALIHSNLPAQLESGYSIPLFVTKPFYRYTGLFNESSPFAFYLSISFCFFKCLGNTYRTYKNVAFLLLVFSGSKFAYIFLILYAALYVRSKIVKILAFILLFILLYLVLFKFDFIFELTSGEIISVVKRFSGMDDTMSSFNFSGTGLKQSSTGDVSLDMFSILSTGFGLCGIIVVFVLISVFFYNINSRLKSVFILPFLISIFSNGSLLIIQYSLLSYCLVYIHNSSLGRTE